ncbi:hypothetical protein GQ600_6568 [Phytophthora cactorum]|nr:hypothetical protein GQ600_6568 [Phytophthora cactorum]
MIVRLIRTWSSKPDRKGFRTGMANRNLVLASSDVQYPGYIRGRKRKIPVNHTRHTVSTAPWCLDTIRPLVNNCARWNPGKYAVARAIKSIQETEFAVSSGITVREEYKAKLRALLSIIAPTTLSTGQPICGKPQVPEGKEIHVLGDLLLLTRAASVDVVENIQEWRKIVHEGFLGPTFTTRKTIC